MSQHADARRMRAIVAVVVTLCVCAVMLTTAKARRARIERDSALADHAQILTQVEQLELLRAKRGVADVQPANADEFVRPFRETLHRAGIAPTSLSQTTLTDPQPIPGADTSRQQISMTIESVAVDNLVRTMIDWRVERPEWTLRSLRLESASTASSSGRSKDNGRFTVFLTYEKLVLSRSAVARSIGIEEFR